MEALESQADGTVSVVTFDAEDPHQEKLLSDFPINPLVVTLV